LKEERNAAINTKTEGRCPPDSRVPLPITESGTLQVKNYFSLISAGTEGSTVKAARSGYIEKAKERPQQVKQVLDTLRTRGLQRHIGGHEKVGMPILLLAIRAPAR